MGALWGILYLWTSHGYQINLVVDVSHEIPFISAIFLVASTPWVSNRGSEVPGTSQNPKPEHSSSDCRRGKVGERWGNSVTLERWDVHQRGFSQFSQDSGFFWWNKVSYWLRGFFKFLSIPSLDHGEPTQRRVRALQPSRSSNSLSTLRFLEHSSFFHRLYCAM